MTPPAMSNTPMAYKHFGFGRWWAINAAGEQIGDVMKKPTAEGLAAAAGVPLLGILDQLPQAD